MFKTNSVEHCWALAVTLLLYPEFRTDAPAHVCLWMGQRPTLRQNGQHSTCTFWSKLWPVQILVLAPKISQITVLHCSKIRTFTQGPEARCRVRQCWREDLRSNFRHVTAASLSQTSRFVIESICQENNIIPNQ